MAKIIITEKGNAVIHGITRALEGDRLFFCDKLNKGEYVARYLDEGEGKEWGTGLNVLLYNGETLRPYLLQYRSVWGNSVKSIVVNDAVMTKTPQLGHAASRILYTKGSDALHDSLAGKSLVVEKIYTGTFNKTKGGEYNWDLFGLGVSDETLTVGEDTVSIDGKTFSLAELQKGFNELENAQNKRLRNV